MEKRKQKQRQRCVPNAIDVKADLHRLKIYLRDYKSTSVERIRARYGGLLVKARKARKSSQLPKIDSKAMEVIVNDGLEEYFTVGNLKPMV